VRFGVSAAGVQTQTDEKPETEDKSQQQRVQKQLQRFIGHRIDSHGGVMWQPASSTTTDC
jgi:hypothetical protein